MKLHVFCYLLVCIYATFASPQAHLKQCAKGPTNWCQNITTAAACKAVPHCIQTVWVHQKLPPDHSTVCETCLEMVKEARDQLLSNETQEEIKEVFEGSCRLIPLKIVAEACIKIVDDFIVELVDILASQMNPQVVCSVAGLCNNEKVHRLVNDLQKSESEIILREKIVKCKTCHAFVDVLEKKLLGSPKESIRQNFLLACGQAGSLSNSCNTLISKHFGEIYSHMEGNLKSSQLCHVAGECSAIFHTHQTKKEIERISASIEIRMGEDQLCRACKQVIQRIKDILVGNTTEAEFKQVLLGLCKQTSAWKDECIKTVDAYSSVIYNFLVNDFNQTVVCSMIAICPRPGAEYRLDGPGTFNTDSTVTTNLLDAKSVQNPEFCAFCEYFLHFVQQALTEPKTENEIKRIVDRICDELQDPMNKTCRQFVDTYSGPFIAMLAQEIDPSIVCPKLKICPGAQLQNGTGRTQNCPLCLLFMETLQEILVKENMFQILPTVCSHLHMSVREHCQDFVATYTDSIMAVYSKNATPMDICKYLNSCRLENKDKSGGNTETNEIPDGTSSGKAIENPDECLTCAFIMADINYEMKDNASEANIRRIVKGVCEHVPKTQRQKCSSFLKTYGERIISDIVHGHSPSILCREMNICKEPKIETVENLECELCKKVLHELEHLITGKPTEEKVTHALEQVCKVFPKGLRRNCDKFVKKHAAEIVKLLIANVLPKEVCKMMQLCGSPKKLDAPVCELCKKVLKEIEELLIDKKTEDEIIKAVHQACEKVPRFLRKECNKFIDEHGQEIIESLEKNVLPGQVCEALQLCSGTTSPPSVDIGTDLCPVCNSVLKNFKNSKPIKLKREEIIVSLYEECTTMPSSIKECNNFVKEYGSNIAHSLETLQPEEVCETLLPCNMKLEEARFEIQSCAVCNDAIHRMHHILWDPKGNHTREYLIETACTNLPTEQEDLCQAIILFNSDELFKMVFQGEDSVKVCSSLGLCHSSETLVGSNKCTRGPGYWCINLKTARECGMVNHCQENIWQKKP